MTDTFKGWDDRVDFSPTIKRTVEEAGPLRRRFAQYLVHECNLSPLTSYTYEHSLRRLERFCGRSATEITVTDVRRFLREAPCSSVTKNGSCVAMRAFHRWGVLEELWPPGPIAAIRGPKLIRNPQPSLSVAEARALLNEARRAIAVRAVFFGLYAGCRVSESASIGEEEWSDPWRLRFMGKGRKIREVPVHPELHARRELILSKRTSRDTLKQTCKSLSFLLGLNFGSHALRRTFSVVLVEAGVDRAVVGDLLGHAPPNVTVQAYAPITWREKVEAIAQLSYEPTGLRALPS